jgi:protein subunit release factor B
MLKFPVSEEKQVNLVGRMRQLHLVEAEIEETYFRVSGPGGQKTNKTLSGVTLLHRPSGIRVRCQRERSQGINRFLARRLLVEELEARLNGKTRHVVKAERLHEEKERRRGSRKSRSPNAPAPAPSLGFDLAKAMNAYYLRPLTIFGSPPLP